MYVYTLKDGIKFDGKAHPQAMPIFILYYLLVYIHMHVGFVADVLGFQF